MNAGAIVGVTILVVIASGLLVWLALSRCRCCCGGSDKLVRKQEQEDNTTSYHDRQKQADKYFNAQCFDPTNSSCSACGSWCDKSNICMNTACETRPVGAAAPPFVNRMEKRNVTLADRKESVTARRIRCQACRRGAVKDNKCQNPECNAPACNKCGGSWSDRRKICRSNCSQK